MAFHTSVNYQISAPEPFTQDVHENLMVDLARIEATSYPSDFDLHIDLSRTFKRLDDGINSPLAFPFRLACAHLQFAGHCVYVSNCYDCLYLIRKA